MKLETKRRRGVYEKVKGSGEWWIRYADGEGKPRREVAGTKSNAISLYQKRKAEVLVGRKLPESLRQRVVRFAEIADDALAYCKANNQGQQFDAYRIGRLKEEFANYAAEVPVEDLRRWFGEQEWKPGTHNRYKSTLSLTYRLAIEHKKASANPARLLKRKREDNGRVRFLNQRSPAKTELEYLSPHADEESRLRAVILAKYPAHMPEFEIALHTGMRPSEQYGSSWLRVDLARKLITIPKSKNGNTRHIPLNSVALAAFQELFERSSGEGRVFVSIHGEPLKGYKHWFDRAVREAGVKDFTWYCLRHTFASRLVMGGVDLRTVAELMGHKTIQMTMRYAHLAPAHKQAAVECLTNAWHSEKPTDTRTDTSAQGQLGGSMADAKQVM
ncbi:MAG: site-specific integrase [Candidatus Sulfotelmatobacter sp.]